MNERNLLCMALEEIDQALAELTRLEEQRQWDKIILIPSESLTPKAVREALASSFTSIYAEGYPREEMLRQGEARLTDFPEQLAYFRRYSDRRFYKGVEFADLVESLACRRVAEAFATPDVGPDSIFVNVQALSGAAANMAIYEALLQPGDTVMALELAQGGHLSHGSPFHQSGKRYRMVRYGVDPNTERLDYEQIKELAKKERPKLIIAGYTSYPWAPDWKKFREIASSCGAFLLADIAHTAGMALAGAYPTPVGYADVVMFTTHKTLCGPRGAVILSCDPDVAARIDAAVFPGAQGGPHVNKWAGLAAAMALARTPQFRRLQHKIVQNANDLAAALAKQGLTLCYGGTDTHLLVLDLRPLRASNGQHPMGEIAARILDLVGIVANKNTIPGDLSAADARGVRYGTPWVTQRGMGKPEMEQIAEITAMVLTQIRPFHYLGVTGPLPRGKVPLGVLMEAQDRVAALVEKFGGTPREKPRGRKERSGVLVVRGGRCAQLLHEASTAHVLSLDPGQARKALFLSGEGQVLSQALIGRLPDDGLGREQFVLLCPSERTAALKDWLSALSDGYVLFDPKDIYRKVQGPAVVEERELEAQFTLDGGQKITIGKANPISKVLESEFAGVEGDGLAACKAHPDLFALHKPYMVGGTGLKGASARQAYTFEVPDRPVDRTPLHSWHVRAGAKMAEFAGYEMPLWYGSSWAEHKAVRERAGLFDLGHMGAFEVSGRYAESFLNLATTNYAGWLRPGQSQYAFLLDPEGQVLDDLMVYRLTKDKFLVVVNAANEAKDWVWLNAVLAGKVQLDPDRPWVEPDGLVSLRDLKREKEPWTLWALQGPLSRSILVRLLPAVDRRRLVALRRTELVELHPLGVEVICTRTGYTGEPLGYELLVPQAEALRLWEALVEAGRPHGLVPCGLAARDSLRTEAGLPLYGHELAGPHKVLPHEAGFAPYVKLHKAFFVGRSAYLRALENWQRELIRFTVAPGQRPLRAGAALADRSGTALGWVTSAVVLEHGQVGMAVVALRNVQEGTEFQAMPAGTTPALPVTVAARFLRKETLPMAGED